MAPDENDSYFIRARGKILGPFNLEQLKRLRTRGKFSRAHEFSTDRRNWEPASTLDLFATERTTPEPEPEQAPEQAPVSDTYQVLASKDGAGPSGDMTVGAAEWHYHLDDQQYGPVTLVDLQRLVKSGRIQREDMVWKESFDDWVPAGNVGELRFPSPPGGRDYGSGRSTRSEVDAKTSGMAITSMVLGILSLLTWCFGIVLGILAVIFGAVSLKAIRNSGGRLTGRGMGITGLTTGIISLVIWACLFALVFVGNVIDALPGMQL